MNIRKVVSSNENPIDDVILDVVDKNVDWYYNHGFNPNGITMLSSVFALLSILSIPSKFYKLGAISLMISYYFDCMDGYMARKYNLVTTAGDCFDHYKDIISYALLVYLLVGKYLELENCNAKLSLIILVIFGILTLMNYGCQEIMVEDADYAEKITSLNILKSLCPVTKKDDVVNVLKFTKWGGSGSSVLLLSILIWSMSYYDK